MSSMHEGLKTGPLEGACSLPSTSCNIPALLSREPTTVGIGRLGPSGSLHIVVGSKITIAF